MRGPPPTPTAILELRGSTLLKGREGEVSFTPGVAEPPDWLTGEARAEWDRIIPELEAAGVLQRLDRALLVGWCETWAEYAEIAEGLRKKWKTAEGRVNNWRWLTQKRAALRELVSMAAHFGCSPAMRARIKGGTPAEEEQGVVSRRRA